MNSHLPGISSITYMIDGVPIASWYLDTSPRQELEQVRSLIPARFHQQWDEEVATRCVDLDLNAVDSNVFINSVEALRGMGVMKELERELVALPNIGKARAHALCCHPLRYLHLILLIGCDPSAVLKESTAPTGSFVRSGKGWNRKSLRELLAWAADHINDFEDTAFQYRARVEEGRARRRRDLYQRSRTELIDHISTVKISIPDSRRAMKMTAS